MDNNSAAIKTLKRMSKIRAELVDEYPFFGRLLLHLIPAAADCSTACTDMTHLVFDPAFAEAISDSEMKFVMLHEVMHCVLKHCTRGQARNQFLYNVACDIVVNSLIFESMGVDSFTVAGEVPMHTAPDGKEGRLFTAEEVYDMLLGKVKNHNELIFEGNISGLDVNGSEYPGMVDSHDIWSDIPKEKAETINDHWEQRIRSAAKMCGSGSGIPLGIKRYISDIIRMSRTNWRQVLAEFIKHDRSDFTFMKRDMRYPGDVIMPSFVENIYGDAVDDLWFCIDASGSVSNEELAVVYAEIVSACSQIDSLSGKIAFFDTMLSEFKPFENEEDVLNIVPVGGGGTSFNCIFKRLAECSDDEKPVGIVILTDGYADFPAESKALGVPVLWGIVGSDVVPKWGTTIYIQESD